MIHLRDYQSAAITQIRQAFRDGKRAPLLVMPTGSGKTVSFAAISQGAAAKGNRVLLLAHRIELIDQISDALTDAQTPHGFVCSGYDRAIRQTMIASVQTLVRRLDAIPAPQLIIIDEAHHAICATYRKIVEHWPQAKILGVTATPIRASGEGLNELFDTMILGPTVAQLTAQGYLVPARIFAPPTMDTSGLHIRMGDYVVSEAEALADRPSVTGDALAHYLKHAEGKRALAFTVSVKHAHHVAEQFRNAGIPAYALDSGTDRTIRRKALKDFRNGFIKVLASCDIFGEGLDVPAVEAGILLRPTQSLALYIQQIGRCLRTFEGKTHALIFDHAGNVLRFGLPSEDRQWSLTGTESTKRAKKATLTVRVCAKCFSASRAGTPVCSNCGHPFEVSPREVAHKDGELQEITPEMLARKADRRMQGRARTLEELEVFGRMKGFAPGWARRVWAARQAKMTLGKAVNTLTAADEQVAT